MVRVGQFNRGDSSSFPGRALSTSAFQSQYCEVFVKDQWWEGLCYFLVWSPSYASAKTLRREHLIIHMLCATVIHTFIVLSTQSTSSLSRKWGRGVTARFHLVVFVYGVNQENNKAGGVQDSQHQWWKASPQTFFQLWKVIGQSHI